MAIDKDRDGTDDCFALRNESPYCLIEMNTTFDVHVTLDQLPPDFAGYAGFDVVLRTSRFTIDDHSTMPWPDCVFDAYAASANKLALACVIGVLKGEPGLLPPSSYTGLIATATFTCDSSGDISLLHGRGNTGITASNFEFYAEAADGADTIRVDCLALEQP